MGSGWLSVELLTHHHHHFRPSRVNHKKHQALLQASTAPPRRRRCALYVMLQYVYLSTSDFHACHVCPRQSFNWGGCLSVYSALRLSKFNTSFFLGDTSLSLHSLRGSKQQQHTKTSAAIACLLLAVLALNSGMS